MFLVGMLNWWYSDGWKARRHTSVRQLMGVAEFFSIHQLFATLFSPFRQISAGRVNGPAGVQLRAFFDQLLSRFIGLIIRSVFIIAGLIIMTIVALFESVLVILWLFVPLLPVAGCIIAVIGWMPWT